MITKHRKKQSTIANKLRLLKLSDDVQFSLNQKQITERHARAMLSLDEEKIKAEEKYDGYYALITSLINEKPEKIIQINKKRWAIEDCFRVMKSYLKARPVYLSKEASIRTHFLVNFVALTILKIIQKI